MDKILSRVNLKEIIKFIFIWIIITILLFILYFFFTNTKKVQYRGVMVENSLYSSTII